MKPRAMDSDTIFANVSGADPAAIAVLDLSRPPRKPGESARRRRHRALAQAMRGGEPKLCTKFSR